MRAGRPRSIKSVVDDHPDVHLRRRCTTLFDADDGDVHPDRWTSTARRCSCAPATASTSRLDGGDFVGDALFDAHRRAVLARRPRPCADSKPGGRRDQGLHRRAVGSTATAPTPPADVERHHHRRPPSPPTTPVTTAAGHRHRPTTAPTTADHAAHRAQVIRPPRAASVGSRAMSRHVDSRSRRGRSAAVDVAADGRRRRASRRSRSAAPPTAASRSRRLDEHQVLAYDLAHAASAVEGCRVMLDYGEHGEYEAMLATAFIADAIADLGTSAVAAREREWGVEPADARAGRRRSSTRTVAARSSRRSPTQLAAPAAPAPRTSPTSSTSCRETFHRFAEDKIRPVAEHVHRDERRHPRGHHRGPGRDRRLRALGPRGVRRASRSAASTTTSGMVVATEELSWGSLGVGRLAHHPARDPHPGHRAGRHRGAEAALAARSIATGELMVGVMVTEPDYGSDVAGVKVTATPVDGGYLINGVKTWATFAGRANVAHAPRPHRPRPQRRTPRPVGVRRRQGAGARARVRVRPGRRRRRWRAAPSTPSATAACTRTRSRSPTGSCPPRTSSARRAGSARASTSRWRGSRTGGCRPRRAPSGSCRPRSRPGSRTRRTATVFGDPCSTTS